MNFTTFYSGVLLMSVGFTLGFLRELFGFHWKGPEERRRKPEQIPTQTATQTKKGSKKRKVRVIAPMFVSELYQLCILFASCSQNCEEDL
jgi:hypothetical protein